MGKKDYKNLQLKSPDLPKIFELFFHTPLAGLFEYFFMFWLHKHLSAMQTLNSKQSIKGYERIFREILGRSGYFFTTDILAHTV